MARWARFAAFAAAGTMVVSAVAACGTSGGSATASPPPAPATSCVQQLDAAQVAQLQQYAASQGNSTEVSTDTTGVSDVCIVDAQGNMQYYNSNDHFDDYLLYAMLLGNSRTLATYGVISGQLTPLEAIELSVLVGVNNNGTMYHPYAYNRAQGGYVRQNVVVNNYHVKTVKYGTAKATKFTSSTLAKAPKVYAKQITVPTPTGKQATVSKGKVKVSTLNPAAASKWGFKNPAVARSATSIPTTKTTRPAYQAPSARASVKPSAASVGNGNGSTPNGTGKKHSSKKSH